MQIRVVELFAGMGTQAMALKRLKKRYGDKCPDFEFVAISEIDENPIKAYNLIHGDTPNLGDVCKINWGGYSQAIDLLTYSFPCQDISTAGGQRGLTEGSGSRSSLLWECKKAIEAKKPKYLLMENVKALTQKKFMPEFQKWIDYLDTIGYTSFWKVVNAKDHGVAQNRERVFMVSILRTEDDPAPQFTFPSSIPLDKCVEDYLEEDVAEEYYIDEKRKTDKVLSDILSQPHVFQELERMYHEEWQEEMQEAHCVQSL